MTITFIATIAILSALKVAVASIPTSTVDWLLRKFELHHKLSEENADISFEGRAVQGAEKANIITAWNESLFLEEYYVHSGNREYYSNPSHGISPIEIVLDTGKTPVMFHVYQHAEYVDVVKQVKSKVRAYKIKAEMLHNKASGKAV
ncbi:YfmQ family protein [Metabacillus lacus]|uniref:YfmQ family protein n=1 Tax=Metabacillus lacus TaxID=1983721 RepID=UPI001478D520|nr:YfmQ family protein [Metabacillus lacus]